MASSPFYYRTHLFTHVVTFLTLPREKVDLHLWRKKKQKQKASCQKNNIMLFFIV